jgi:hypothetical protein
LSRRTGPALLLLLAPALLAQQQCNSPTLVVTTPPEGGLVDDASLFAEGSLGPSFDVSTAQVRIDLIDLVASLGLEPPFAGASGVVAVGGQLLAISDFSFRREVENGVFYGPWRVKLEIAGLALGSHRLELYALETKSGQFRRGRSEFQVVAPFTLEAQALSAAGLRKPKPAGSEGTLHSAAFGEPFAAPPVPLAGGGELRAGFVEVSEARIAGGTP